MTLVDQHASFVFDPKVVGYDTSFIKAISGTPTVSSSKLRLNASEISTYAFFKFIDVTFTMLIPAAPTAGDVRAWGLKIPGLGNQARIEFDITDNIFSCKVYDDYGTEILNQVVTWSATWTNAVVRYRIRFGHDGIKFFVDLNSLLTATCVARISMVGNEANPVLLTIPQMIHVINSNADNVDVSAIIVRNAQSLT